MAKKITDKVMRDLIIEVIKEATEDEARAEAQKVLDANPNAEIKDVIMAIRALGKADKTGSPSLRDAKRIAKEIFPADEPEVVADEPEEDDETEAQPPQPPQPQPPQPQPPQPQPPQLVTTNLSNYITTNPFFKFDIFTSSDLDDRTTGARNQQKILLDIHDKLLDKIGTNFTDKLTFLIKLFNDPEVEIGAIKDPDGDLSDTDDKISTFFRTYIMYSFLDFLSKSNVTSAGFFLENWLALILGGNALQYNATRQVYDITGQGETFSLKFYSGTTNLTQANAEPKTSYNYILAEKDKPNPTTITFYIRTLKGSKLAGNGITTTEFATGAKNAGTIDLSKFPQKIQDIKSKIMQSNDQEIISFIDDFGTNIDYLKVLLTTYFMKPDPTVATGVAQSAKACLRALDGLGTKAGFIRSSLNLKRNYSSNVQQIVRDNIDLLETTKLPTLLPDQLQGQTINGVALRDHVMSIIPSLLQGPPGLSGLPLFVSMVNKMTEYFNNVIGNPTALQSTSTEELFAQALTIQCLKYFYDLKSAANKDQATGGGVASNVAGFLFEGLIDLLASGVGTSGGDEYYTLGGNDQKLDACIISPIAGSSPNKWKILGLSQKTRKLDSTKDNGLLNDDGQGRLSGLFTFDTDPKIFLKNALETIAEIEGQLVLKQDLAKLYNVNPSSPATDFFIETHLEIAKSISSNLPRNYANEVATLLKPAGTTIDQIYDLWQNHYMDDAYEGDDSFRQEALDKLVGSYIDLEKANDPIFAKSLPSKDVLAKMNLDISQAEYMRFRDKANEKNPPSTTSQKKAKKLIVNANKLYVGHSVNARIEQLKAAGVSDQVLKALKTNLGNNLPSVAVDTAKKTKQLSKAVGETAKYFKAADSGNSNVIYIEAVYKHAMGGNAPSAVKNNMLALEKAARKLATDQDRVFSWGSLFGGIRASAIGKDLSEYKTYRDHLEQFYETEYRLMTSAIGDDNFSIAVGPDEGGDVQIGSGINFTQYQDYLNELTKELNNRGSNMMEVFEDFNEFKLVSSTFLSDPTAQSFNTSLLTYDELKKSGNQALKGQGIQITEAVITAMMLQKLISESFKK